MELAGDPVAVGVDRQLVAIVLVPGMIAGQRHVLGERGGRVHLRIGPGLVGRHDQHTGQPAARGEADHQRLRALRVVRARLHEMQPAVVVGLDPDLGVQSGERLGATGDAVHHEALRLIAKQPAVVLAVRCGQRQPDLDRAGPPGFVRDQLGTTVRCRHQRGRGPGRGGQPALTAPSLGEQPGVVDRHPGRRGEGDDQPLVGDGELGAVHLVAEIEVAEHRVADVHRHTEEAVQLRMVGGESDRGRVLGDLGDAEAGAGR